MAEFKSKEELYTALDAMVANMQENEKFISRIARANASLGFTVTDLDNAEYSLYFENGAFRGASGGAKETTVGLTLKAATLDKMLSGKMSGESAYMSGALRLCGSEWTAQSIAGYLWYIKAAYKEAVGEA